MAKYKIPGVYVEGISTHLPSVAQVETAIPAFIGYTERGTDRPTRIKSMTAYRNIFGEAYQGEIGTFEIDQNNVITSPAILTTPAYKMYYMLDLFFANGGGDCYIISVGHYDDEVDSVRNAAMEEGLRLLNKEDAPTLILFPDATGFKNSGEPTEVYRAALAQCAERKDRFLICDVEQSDKDVNTVSESAAEFRFAIGINDLKYGAAYFPALQTTLTYSIAEENIRVYLKNRHIVLRHTKEAVLAESHKTEDSLYHADNGKYKGLYRRIKTIINSNNLELPPSAAVAGVYAKIDATRGVWKAPANVSLNKVRAPKLNIGHSEQADLNVSSSGKSINAIRSFTGKGVLVWGARTLAGNDNEWRYIPVRRFFSIVEKSVKKALEPFEFEPNDANTWIKVKAMIENYLIMLWRSGAVIGSKPEEAFFVKVGLGETMTAQDLLDGEMIIEIGMAVIKPAEFIVLKRSQKMVDT